MNKLLVIIVYLTSIVVGCQSQPDKTLYSAANEETDESQLIRMVVPNQYRTNATLTSAYLNGYALGAASMFRHAGGKILVPDIIDYVETSDKEVEAYRQGYHNGQESAVMAMRKAVNASIGPLDVSEEENGNSTSIE